MRSFIFFRLMLYNLETRHEIHFYLFIFLLVIGKTKDMSFRRDLKMLNADRGCGVNSDR